MRTAVDRARIGLVMEALGRAADQPISVYLAGGATAVLMGWRSSTVDIDFMAVPDNGAMMRAIPALKESLEVNLEIAGPAQFIPVSPGWEHRSPFIARHGQVDFYHFDLVAQALAKLERRHARDRADVDAMVARGLISAADVRAAFAQAEPELYRFPAIDPPTFRRAVDEVFPPDHDG